ncbi:hypothetical protein LXD69_00085 [Flavobacterium sediminilitoris]|uniref:GLPGLI family protein n=1 Tax=Flavobacterium sediminilitoris TaxID=2024526 RepID=A0ABY4HM39_9FLAO|nr:MULTISPECIES: hypothetical protein [Flavobacterium]UOX33929.1 hypothetical protein LXD69_00085 [Flavobacterium sediminilitoris]
MKKNLVLFLVFTFGLFFGQNKNHSEKFKTLEPDVWLNIWDKENSDKSIKIDTLFYDEIPKYLEFRGTVVEALRWNDALGENILIQTVTGHFNWKDYDENLTDFMLQDKSELFAYLFRKKRSENEFSRVWKLYDYNKCYGVDWFTGFIPKATTITDIDKDGISEITLPYVLICRGGMDPGEMKIIMYEDNVKYALRGTTMLMCKSKEHYGGEFEPSDNLKKESTLYDFLKKRWETHKCENDRFY